MSEWCLINVKTKVIQNGIMNFSKNLFSLKYIVAAILDEIIEQFSASIYFYVSSDKLHRKW